MSSHVQNKYTVHLLLIWAGPVHRLILNYVSGSDVSIQNRDLAWNLLSVHLSPYWHWHWQSLYVTWSLKKMCTLYFWHFMKLNIIAYQILMSDEDMEIFMKLKDSISWWRPFRSQLWQTFINCNVTVGLFETTSRDRPGLAQRPFSCISLDQHMHELMHSSLTWCHKLWWSIYMYYCVNSPVKNVAKNYVHMILNTRIPVRYAILNVDLVATCHCTVQ